MTKREKDWHDISDENVRHIWLDDVGKAWGISPMFYENSGIPIDEASGRDMVYVRTEIKTGKGDE